MDLEAVHIADDQERRILQGLAIQKKLAVGLVQVLVPALVLPSEEVALPNVGPTLRPVGLAAAAFELDFCKLSNGVGKMGVLGSNVDVSAGRRRAGPFGGTREGPA
ncbi:MAG: hypothetical protein ABSF26_21830, partial [Thermoguttaceae bacterium]